MHFLNEESLIEFIRRSSPSEPSAGLGIGDDAAIIPCGSEQLVVSVDTVREEIHFSFRWCSPFQAGIRAIETAASDICAMGVLPESACVALCAGHATSETHIEGMIEGMGAALRRLNMTLLGGDIVRGGSDLTVSVTVFGRLPEGSRYITRSGARVGDKLFITGPTGMAGAGLELCRQKRNGPDTLLNAHREPRCRNDFVQLLTPDVTALMDISDGLIKDCRRLSAASKVRLIIDDAKVPRHPDISDAVSGSRVTVEQCIYHGGDDYELLFTASDLAPVIPGAIEIGSVVEGEGVGMLAGGLVREAEEGGYDHLD